jgi:hypothetical protein
VVHHPVRSTQCGNGPYPGDDVSDPKGTVLRAIEPDEWYPVYTLEPVGVSRSPIVEVTAEELERYERVMAEFADLQRWLDTKRKGTR